MFLENDDVILTEKVVALVRLKGETEILMADSTVRTTGFTPLTLSRRRGRFRNGAVKRKERHI